MCVYVCVHVCVHMLMYMLVGLSVFIVILGVFSKEKEMAGGERKLL